MNALIAKALPAGGTIGIVSPASPYKTYSDVLRGIAWWEARGYHVKLADGALARKDWCAGDPEVRARDLMKMFTDPSVDAIQCLRGGYGSAQVVPLLDFQVIADNPKPFVGFSDITALHTALLRFTSLATFYGPSFTSLGDPQMTEFTGQQLLVVLGGETTGPLPRNRDDPFVRTLEGRLGSLGVPLIYKLPFGHGTHFATLPLGVQATLDASTCTLEVTEPSLLLS
jgi:muramoyltetrapeptide carboxypeptidase